MRLSLIKLFTLTKGQGFSRRRAGMRDGDKSRLENADGLTKSQTDRKKGGTG